MSKVLVVVNATGQQGSSVIDTILNDVELNKEYSVRGTTRDPGKSKAQELSKKGVEIVEANVDDPASLKKAFEGAHVIFANTITIYDGHTAEHELAHGRALVDAAVAAGVPRQVQKYWPLRRERGSCFMSNFGESMKPHPAGDGSYVFANFVKPETQVPLIDTAGDTGKWIAAILADFSAYEGKILCAATGFYSFREIADAMSKASGKSVVYAQLPKETWRGFLPELMRDHVAEMLEYFQDFGYYGEDTEKKVKWAAEQARGKLTTLEQYFQRCPLNLA
ncbi:hypothetical protein ACMFMG_006634 [Clarireedia jacksonii]